MAPVISILWYILNKTEAYTNKQMLKIKGTKCIQYPKRIAYVQFLSNIDFGRLPEVDSFVLMQKSG